MASWKIIQHFETDQHQLKTELRRNVKFQSFEINVSFGNANLTKYSTAKSAKIHYANNFNTCSSCLTKEIEATILWVRRAAS